MTKSRLSSNNSFIFMPCYFILNRCPVPGCLKLAIELRVTVNFLPFCLPLQSTGIMCESIMSNLWDVRDQTQDFVCSRQALY